MVKILGGSLVLIAAYLFGMKLMEPAAEHIRLLEEGDLLYRILESEIRNTRTPLPILFERLLKKTWKEKFSKEEQNLFLNAGRNLLSDDMEYQREEIKQLSTYLNEKILQMKKEYTNKKKVVLISCLCMGALAVILLF